MDGDTIAHVGAGESWDQFVSAVVARDLSGVECLSGIPGNGRRDANSERRAAHGQEVVSVIDRVAAMIDRNPH